ncbi:MAG: hypothetical protein HZY78_02645 [Burkholderiaceae bacterium]|nr:MAG: hypothetical protein HZY78_02645 [Burkholderiaceae bacterium]
MFEARGTVGRLARSLCAASVCLLGAVALAQAPRADDDAPQAATPIPTLAPPSFDLGRLLTLPRPAGATLDFGIDPQTLSVSPEGVVRFVLVASSGSARTVVYQAIRCSGFDYRIEARYQTADDGTGAWSRAPEASPGCPWPTRPWAVPRGSSRARACARAGCPAAAPTTSCAPCAPGAWSATSEPKTEQGHRGWVVQAPLGLTPSGRFSAG